MAMLNMGIVSTGFIAGVIAPEIVRSAKTRLVAVSSRSKARAAAFAADFPGVDAVEGAEELIARSDVDAVYIAVPTAMKEEIAVLALNAGKHVLIEKPLASADSARRLAALARERNLLLMDATHFAHHARTRIMRERMPELIGTPRSLGTMFYFPFSDRENIRFDPANEPMGAVGDMAWYAMRAVVEYLAPQSILKVEAFAERDPATNALIRATGLLVFDEGKTTTFDVGYTANAAVMDLSLAGTAGVLGQDDFVLDWHSGFGFDNPDIPTGFTHRAGMATRKDIVFIPTPDEKSQHARMIETFAEDALSADEHERARWATATIRTQDLLDAVWRSVQLPNSSTKGNHQ